MNTSPTALALLEARRAARARAPLAMTAIETLYREYGALVRRRARALLGSEDAAEDALHDIFVKAIDHRDEFRAAAQPQTWLYRVTLNHCLNVKRDARRRRELLEEKVAPAVEQAAPSAESVVDAHRLLARVSEEVSAAARCFYLGGLTQDETAAALGVSRRTVGHRLQAFRATVERP